LLGLRWNSELWNGSGDYTPDWYAYDGNGNVSEVISGTVNWSNWFDPEWEIYATEHYEYDAFGKVIAQWNPDPASDPNPFRFSTKWHEGNGLVYYGYRFYTPETGRWPSRDPIGDESFRRRLCENKSKAFCRSIVRRSLDLLYQFVHNSPIGGYDLLGLCEKNPTRAARQIIANYNPKSIKENREFGGLVCRDKNGCIYTTVAAPGSLAGVAPRSAPCKPCDSMVADWHTHGAVNDANGDGVDDHDSEHFSPQDIADNEAQGVDGYLGTPSGNFQQYDVDNNIIIDR